MRKSVSVVKDEQKNTSTSGNKALLLSKENEQPRLDFGTKVRGRDTNVPRPILRFPGGKVRVSKHFGDRWQSMSMQMGFEA